MALTEVPASTRKDAAALAAKFTISKQVEFRGELTLHVAREQFREVAVFLKEQLGYTYLIDISSVDHAGNEPRFEVVYEVQNFERGDHLRIKYPVSEDDLTAPSVVDLWATADWHEREIFDMMGINFPDHPDVKEHGHLRRILMWDGYPYFPLRKEFPLAGLPSEMPDVAFTDKAPLAGGPFVTSPSTGTSQDREPRSRAQTP
jgi:NADH-quinone oxidoreductase subunit C